MYYLGIDPATESGFCVMDGLGFIKDFCVINIKRLSGLRSQDSNPGLFFSVCYDSFLDLLSGYASLYGIMVCGLEHPKFLVKTLRYTSHVQMGICGILQCLLHRLGFVCHLLNPSVIKKSATGRGNANKDLMLSFSRDLGYSGDNHNIADAVHIGNYVRKLDLCIL